MEVVWSFFNIMATVITDILYDKALINNLFSFDLDKKEVIIKNLKYYDTNNINNKNDLNENGLKENSNILDELNVLIKEIDYIILDNSRQKKTFVKIKNFLSETIKDEMGKQNFEEVKQIYIFNGEKKQELNKYIFLGASNSLKFVRTVQCVELFGR